MSVRLRHSLLLCAVLLGGCQSVVAAVATPIVWQKKHVNLLNSSYAATETLIYNSGNRLTKSTPLVINDLYEIIPQKDPTDIYPQGKKYDNPRLGKVLTEQIKMRFVQLGYNVHSTVAGNASSGAEVNGTYEVTGDALTSGDLKISLRLTDKKTGRVLGLYDYMLPVTSEIKDHMAQGNMVIPSFLRD